MEVHARHALGRGRTNEAELLLAAACLHPGPADVIRAHAAMSPASAIDWQSFVPLAHRHGVLPLLYHHISTGAFDARLIPDAALTRLRHEAERTARRSLMLAGELVSLLRELEDNGIRVVPLKGPVLAQQLYASVALRHVKDLDLLVAEHDIERATALIVRRGYRTDPSWGSDALDAMHHDVSHDVQLHSTTKHCRVELHYYMQQPIGRQRHTLAVVEGELERVSFFGRSVLVLEPEALLVYLCIHGALHAWERIEWIGGVAELLRGGRIADWERVNESARRRSADRALRSGLHLAHELFDAPMPGAELRGDRSARIAARSVAMRLTRDPMSIPGPTTRLVHHVRTDMGIRTRAARVWSTLFAPTMNERKEIPLPRALSALHYVLRPARLVVRRLHRSTPSR
jgi:hypothetical protein